MFEREEWSREDITSYLSIFSKEGRSVVVREREGGKLSVFTSAYVSIDHKDAVVEARGLLLHGKISV